MNKALSSVVVFSLFFVFILVLFFFSPPPPLFFFIIKKVKVTKNFGLILVKNKNRPIHQCCVWSRTTACIHMHIGYTYKYRKRRENDDKNPIRINQSLTVLSKPITDLRNDSSDERHDDHPEVKENHDDTIRPKRSAASPAKVSDRTTSH